jgi:L-asparaginase
MNRKRYVSTAVVGLLSLALVVGGAAPVLSSPVLSGPASGARKPADPPKVAVIGTGGTIAGEAASRVDFQTYQAGKLPIGDLVKSLQPEVGKVADVSTSDFGTKGSGDYTIADYYDLSRQVDEQLKRADAAVITTGTQTMEELAYWLDLTVRSSKPVVVTGSMRPWNVIGSDGPSNLYNAVVLAASGRTACFGSVIMLNDEIMPARDATKTSTSRLDTFQSPELGNLGTIDGKNIRLLRAPARFRDCGQASRWQTPFDLATMQRDKLPRVEIFYTYADAGGEPVTAFANAGVRGLVAAGTPSPQQFTAATAAIKSGMTVVASNKNNTGAVYDTPGGVIPAEDLLPQKARLLLLLSLARTGDPAQVRRWFDEYGVPQFTPAP